MTLQQDISAHLDSLADYKVVPASEAQTGLGYPPYPVIVRFAGFSSNPWRAVVETMIVLGRTGQSLVSDGVGVEDVFGRLISDIELMTPTAYPRIRDANVLWDQDLSSLAPNRTASTGLQAGRQIAARHVVGIVSVLGPPEF